MAPGTTPSAVPRADERKWADTQEGVRPSTVIGTTFAGTTPPILARATGQARCDPRLRSTPFQTFQAEKYTVLCSDKEKQEKNGMEGSHCTPYNRLLKRREAAHAWVVRLAAAGSAG